MGIPGMLLAIPGVRLREPVRGEAEGATVAAASAARTEAQSPELTFLGASPTG